MSTEIHTQKVPSRGWSLALDLLICLALGALALWLRWPALSTDGFHNEDTAGITYQADLLAQGRLPYVHAYEIKEPGSFFGTWLVWEVFGRSLVVIQRFASAWAILGLWGVYAGARVLYPQLRRGRALAALAGLLYALASPVSDSIDFNYNNWMAAPAIWSAVVFVWALRTERLLGLVGAGALMALTGLMKRQGAVTFPLYVAFLGWPMVLWLWARLRQRSTEGLLFFNPLRAQTAGPPRSAWARLFAYGGGLALGFAPLGIFYATKGYLKDLIVHYFFSPGGWRYVKGELGWSDRLVRLYDGWLGFWEFMALPSWLMVLAIVWGLLQRPRLGARGLFLTGHFLLSFVAAALGFRFFKGYYLQVLPAAVWVAAHPRGPIGQLLTSAGRAALGRGGVGLLAAGLVLSVGGAVPAVRKDVQQLRQIRKMRERSLDAQAQRVARVINANKTAEDQIWVWGRWAWPVYYHTQLFAPTRFHKVLGVVTTNLTNTWRRPTMQTSFVRRGPEADELMGELGAAPPAFIVVSRNEDYRDFTEFRAFLNAHYRVVPHFVQSQFVTWVRKDHPLPVPPRPRPAPKR